MSHFLNSPIFTGNPQAPTALTADNSTSIATTAWVKAQGYGSGGNVTAIGVTTSNGVSGSSSGGTTPSLTISLGAITPSTVNGLTFTANTTGFSVGGGTTSKTLTVGRTLTLTAADDTSTLTVPAGGGTLGSNAFTSTAFQTTANLSTTNTLGTSDTLYPSQNAVKTYVDTAVLGLLDDRGSYNASGNTFPASGGSGSAGAIMKGDLWYISVQGTLGGVVAQVGATVRALADTPGQTAANWDILNVGLGYTPATQSQTMFIGTSSVAINATTGTFTTIAGMSSITSTTFVGALTGNASTATAVAGGAVNQLVYQTGAGASSFVTTANYGVVTTGASGTPAVTVGAAGVLQGSASAIPAWTTTPTLTGTNFTGIPGGAINSAVATATAIAAGTANQMPYQTGAGATSFFSSANYGVVVSGATGVPQTIAGSAGVLVGSASAIPAFSTTPSLTGTNFTGIPGGAINSAVATATAVAAGTANQVLYQSGAGVTAFATAGNYGVLTTSAAGVPVITAGAAGVLQGSASAIPAWTSSPTLTGTNFTGVPWGALPSTGSHPMAITGTAKTGIYTITNADDVLLCDATSGGFTITLPASPVAGEHYTIKKIDSSANAITVGGNAKNIDGASTQSLPAQWNAITVVYNGSAWYII